MQFTCLNIKSGILSFFSPGFDSIGSTESLTRASTRVVCLTSRLNCCFSSVGEGGGQGDDLARKDSGSGVGGLGFHESSMAYKSWLKKEEDFISHVSRETYFACHRAATCWPWRLQIAH